MPRTSHPTNTQSRRRGPWKLHMYIRWYAALKPHMPTTLHATHVCNSNAPLSVSMCHSSRSSTGGGSSSNLAPKLAAIRMMLELDKMVKPPEEDLSELPMDEALDNHRLVTLSHMQRIMCSTDQKEIRVGGKGVCTAGNSSVCVAFGTSHNSPIPVTPPSLPLLTSHVCCPALCGPASPAAPLGAEGLHINGHCLLHRTAAQHPFCELPTQNLRGPTHP